MRKAQPFVFWICLILIGARLAVADDIASPPLPAPSATQADEQKTIGFFGVDHDLCGEWTDGCVICSRTDLGRANCSVTGISCQPTETTCKEVMPKTASPIPKP